MSTFARTPRSSLPVSFTALVGVFALLLVLPSCGGEGGPTFRIDAPDPLGVTTALPQLQSGDAVDWEIPIAGGCGGPYVLEIIGGALPRGVGMNYDDGQHNLVGLLLEDGDFEFTLKVTDTNCTPFSTTTAAFTWSLATGPVRIVAADPAIVLNADFNDPSKYEDSWGPDGAQGTADDDTPGFTVDALETVVYGSYSAIDLIVAGGIGPYVCQILDDPDDPLDDVGLPTPTAFAVNSCTIIGTPIQVLPGGLPFRFTVRVTDGAGNYSDRKFQWKIDTPPIIQANQTLADGTAGVAYSDIITVVDGVPPIVHEFLDELPKDDGTVDPLYTGAIQYVPGSIPVVPLTEGGLSIQFTSAGSTVIPGDVPNSARLEPIAGRTQYPAENDNSGQYGPYPSEGMYIKDGITGAGAVLGIPERHGAFTVNVHSYSTLVPNERGQHAIKQLPFNIAQTGSMTISAEWTVEKTWIPGPDFSSLPEFEIGQSYDPEPDGTPGLQLVATGGVVGDGYFSNPHESERFQNLAENANSYGWRSDWLPDNPAPSWDAPPAGLSFDATGVVDVSNSSLLVRTVREYVEIEAQDYQLPVQDKSVDMVRVGYSIGPDLVIITHSTQSLSNAYSYWSTGQRHDWNDMNMKVMRFQGFASGPQRSALDGTDMAATHTLPADADLAAASNPLGALLSGLSGYDPGMDFMRGVVNATGYWDDLHGLNPKSARPGQKADFNRSYAYYGEFGYSYSNHGNWQPSVSAIDLPDTPTVSHNPAAGIYNDGGQCYHFESANRFGLFVLRTDGKIYVPYAAKQTSSNQGFGDGMLHSYGTSGRHGAFRTVQMTVSPDGRFAAMKIKTNQHYLHDHASNSKLLLVSLTGEKIFGETSPGANDGATWKLIDTGYGLTGSGNRVAYAASLALTNDYLYFVIGTRCASSTSTSSTPLIYQSWASNYLMRYEILGGATGAHMLPRATTDTAWTQASNVPMQTVYHHNGPNVYTSAPYLRESSTTYGYWPYHRYWQEEGMNFSEHNTAPTPFRVSANGKAVALFAAQDYVTTGASTYVYSTYCWVDYDGAGVRRATGTRRHHSVGSARGYTVVRGPNEYAMWGRYHGPTPGVEISDDGKAVAFNYNTNSTIDPNYSYSSSYWKNARENVILTRSTSGNWASYTEHDVTANTFGGSHKWRFGCFAFTAPNASTGASDGLVFWAGAPVYQSTSTSYTYVESDHYSGTFYSHVIGSSNQVRSMCATAEGGSPDGEGKLYTSSSKFQPSGTSGFNNRFGAIFPYGGFMSRNRNFLYVTGLGPVSTSGSHANTGGVLVGMNISKLSTGSINGHTNGRAFVPASWPARRGFIGNYYYYYGNYYPMYYGYAPQHHQGGGRQVMAKDTGWVFWGVGYAYQGPQQGTYSSYGMWVYSAYYYGCYGYGGVGLFGFDADVGGPVAQLNNPTLSSTGTTMREMLNFIDVTRDGTSLTYVSTYDYYQHYKNRERVNYVKNIGFNANGTIVSSFNANNHAGRLETSNGRAGEAMSTSAASGAVYYAFKSGASNETSREIVRARWDPLSSTFEFTRYTTLPGRMNVLFATR